MNFSFSTIMASFVFGVIGIYLFRAGKRNANGYWMMIAGALMVYPMFSPNAWIDWGAGIGLCALAYFLN